MDSASNINEISVIIPVYQGEKTLSAVVEELMSFADKPYTTKHGHLYRISETILVHDGAIDHSSKVIQQLSNTYDTVRPIWLSKNFGQHPATLAGIASSTFDWIVTMDEDGQQNPADIAHMLDRALEKNAQLVYAKPLNPPPHGSLRNILSASAKKISIYILGHNTLGHFNSFRLIEGEIGRSLAAYCSNSVFLDVALLWITTKIAHCPVYLRKEHDRPSGYSFKKLLKHFWQLLLTSGTRPLRFITLLGFLSIILGIGISTEALYAKYILKVPVQGWASIVIVVSFFSGCILFSLGIIAEYLVVALNILMGKPLYIIVSKPPQEHMKKI